MSKINIKDDLLKSLMLPPVNVNGTGSHYIGSCPFCNKVGHFYMQRETDRVTSKGDNASFYWNCKKCSESGSIVKYLKKIGRTDIIKFDVNIEQSKLENKLHIVKDEFSFVTETVQLPFGYERYFDVPYLKLRGFNNNDYYTYEVGGTRLLAKFKSYLIILVIENREVVGYLGRTTFSKEDVKRLEVNGQKVLRWKNSESTDFAKIFYGLDEVIENETKTVILVEGFFKKVNIDKLLQLQTGVEVKCLVTFGKKISEYQIWKLQQKKVQNIVLLYDPDAVNESKQFSQELDKYFNTLVGFSLKDPDEINEIELIEILENLQKPCNFVNNFVNKKTLNI